MKDNIEVKIGKLEENLNHVCNGLEKLEKKTSADIKKLGIDINKRLDRFERTITREHEKYDKELDQHDDRLDNLEKEHDKLLAKIAVIGGTIATVVSIFGDKIGEIIWQ
jgi:DNA repair exonuclease SbcCD ATPase subunit